MKIAIIGLLGVIILGYSPPARSANPEPTFEAQNVAAYRAKALPIATYAPIEFYQAKGHVVSPASVCILSNEDARRANDAQVKSIAHSKGSGSYSRQARNRILPFDYGPSYSASILDNHSINRALPFDYGPNK